ncbi:MAG: hypothetical protein R8P61_03125 [Bacteroidia bacterium]|nr:hypothetical protein [Bacteroidia bacterium]
MVKIFLIIISLLFNSQAFGQKNETPQELGKIVFEALTKKDSALFEKAKTNEADLIFAIQRMMKKVDKEIEDEKIKETYTMYSTNFMLSFLETIKQGENEGIEWSKITYSKTYFNERPDSDPEHIEIGRTYLEFKYQDKFYVIKIGDSIKIKGNWTIEDKINWIGKRDKDDSWKSNN